jgi:drug/metabolite transporter (DMT)-like permease
MFLALRFTSPLHTSIIFALVPSFSGLYAFLLAGERLSKAQLIALACGLIGVIWVIFRGDLGRFFSLEWNRGDAIFLGGCLAMGLYTPLIKLLHRGESMVVLTFWILVTGACWLFAYSVRMLGSIGWGNIPWQVWGGILYLAVFTTIVTFFLTQYAVLFLGPTRVAAYSYLYPGLVLLLDLALGHGLPSPAVLPGIGVVLVAMVVLQLAAGRDRDDT